MNSSILNSIKEAIGGISDYTVFDSQLILYINGIFSELFQLGVSKDGKQFRIKDASAVWQDVISDEDSIDLVQTYMAAKAKLRFDPPANSFLVNALKEDIKELEWRINVVAESEGFTGRDIEIRVANLEERVTKLEDNHDDVRERLDEHDEYFKILVGEEHE